MTNRIDDFIKEQSCASICCLDELGQPYCFSCFYAYDSAAQLLCYKTAADSRHYKMMQLHHAVAGTILPDKLNKLHIRGLQFEGMVLSMEDPLAKNAAAWYYKKNPVALAMPGEVWTIQVNSIKLTDSHLGFGKKITWSRNEMAVHN